LMKIKIMNAATFGAKTKIVTNVQKYKQNIWKCGTEFSRT
jgi:hypothetical protein